MTATMYIDSPRSAIAQAFLDRYVEDLPIMRGGNWADLERDQPHRFLFLHGRLDPMTLEELGHMATNDHWQRNFVKIARQCDEIIRTFPRARICVIGSMSGEHGSHNMAYAGAKAALHCYVRNKKLTDPYQQLFAIAPTIIENAGMTIARPDRYKCIERGKARRRGRWLQSDEVARLIRFGLFRDSGSLCNTVIEMTGGNW